MDHRRHVECHQLLVERIPVAIGQRRRGPVAARRVGVQVAADEAELVDTQRSSSATEWAIGTPGDCGS